MLRVKRLLMACLVAIFAITLSLCFVTMPKKQVASASTVNTKDVAMLARVAGWYGNGNFEIRFTLGERDWEDADDGQKTYAGANDLPTLLNSFDFFNKVKLGDKTLAQWGCTTCYSDSYWLNNGEPKYTIMIPLSMGSGNMANATAAGISANSPVTILEGALIPGHGYLQGDTTATVYRAGCDYVSQSASVDYSIMAVGKTDVVSLDFVTGWDSTYNNSYLGVSLKGDDYAGNGVQTESKTDYESSVFKGENHFTNTITVNGESSANGFDSVAESYGLFNLGSKGKGFFAFTARISEEDSEYITIPAGTLFPSFAMTTLYGVNSHYVYIMYETQNDVTFVKQEDGTWAKEIEATVSHAAIFHEASDYADTFGGIAIEGSNFASAPNTYEGDVKKAKTFARSENFLSHVLIDGASPYAGEGFLNVWSNYGYFCFRPGNSDATEITILAGCKIPTYNALALGYDEVYVVSQDVTFKKNANDEWVLDNGIDAGEYDTSIRGVVFGRTGGDNWMMITLTDSDYPKPDEVSNVEDVYTRVASTNIFDKIVVDGYTLRAREGDKQPKINHWGADCFGFKVPGVESALDGAQTVTIRAGAQFPSYAYLTEGIEAYFVTTEEITFVNVGANNGVWERQYTAKFIVDGEEYKNVKYVLSQGLVAPEVPEKEGYKGSWESYTANGDIVVNAVYTQRTNEFAYTNISEVADQDGFLILTLMNHDYQSAPGTWWGPNGKDVKDVLNAMKAMDFHLYGADGKEIALGEDAIINVWGRTGTLSFYVSGGIANYSQVTFKKGCEIPSYEQINSGAAFNYELIEDVTFIKQDGVWVRQSEAMELPEDSITDVKYESFNDHYVFSDLYKEGYSGTEEFADGIQELVFGNNIYGYINSTSFTLTFDFKYTEGTYYDSFLVKLGTTGYHGNESHFGWRFFLLRGSDGSVTPNYCVQYFSDSATKSTGPVDADGNISAPSVGSQAFVNGQTYTVTVGYELVDPTTGTIRVYADIAGLSTTVDTYTLSGNFVTFCQQIDKLVFAAEGSSRVVVGDPGKDLSKTTAGKVEINGEEIYADSIILPELDPVENNQIGKVFVGWTTDLNGISTLYPAGYEYEVSSDVELFPVFVGFAMEDGASVRLNNGTGIRFTVLVDGASYDVIKSKILESGIILAPTSYLSTAELTHGLGKGYFIESVASTWSVETGANRKFASAFTNISPEQYAREFSARGYLKVNFTSGEGYVYSQYSKENNSRSIYQVAAMAKEAGEASETLTSYVEAVADLEINSDFDVERRNGAKGTYSVTGVVKNGNTVTVTLSQQVKTVVINNVRIVMGYSANVLIGGLSYEISGYKLSGGVSIVITLTQKDEVVSQSQYIRQLQEYLSRTDYTDLHYNHVKGLVEDAVYSIENSAVAGKWKSIYEDAVAIIESVKNAVQHEANDGENALANPVLSKGLGYTVTWNKVDNADYYTVHDDNDYRDSVVVMAGEDSVYVYEAEVIGNHNITVVAHSYYEEYCSSESNVIATPEVKPVFSYKAMSDGLYKFDSDQMRTMGLSGLMSTCQYDKSDDKYFVYYNKNSGWSPYSTMRTDWTSPDEFPAHAQRLKDIGNNIILVNRDTAASYTETDTWQSSRLKYVMDTAWSMGMKVLVCDEVLYKLSISESDADGAATSKDEVLTAIKNRQGFEDYVTHPAFYGFSLDDEPHSSYISGALAYTIQALQEKCSALGVQPFYLACLYQIDGGGVSGGIFDSAEQKLTSYYKKWFNIDGEGIDYIDYLYVDIYTKHAMGQPTDRYNNTFKVVYGDNFLGNKSNNYKFYQAITAHTQNTPLFGEGVLLEQDMYMSLLYAAAHNVAGYSWFCYFPISGETSGSMVGFDGNGYGNGIGNGAMENYSYYNAAKTSGYIFELIQGLLDGYSWETRSVSGNKLTTTLSNGTRTATFYVNADVTEMSDDSIEVTASGSECYLVGYGVGTAEAPYQTVSGSVTLAPGQAVICIS